MLVEVALVGAATSLGHDEELVRRLVSGVSVGVELDLGGKIGPGVALLPHRQRRHLRIAKVEIRIGVVHAVREVLLVLTCRPDVLTLLAHDDRRAGVLAHRQHATRSHVGVLEQIKGDKAIVRTGLGIVEDASELFEVCGPQQVGNIFDALVSEQPQRFGFDSQN